MIGVSVFTWPTLPMWTTGCKSKLDKGGVCELKVSTVAVYIFLTARSQTPHSWCGCWFSLVTSIPYHPKPQVACDCGRIHFNETASIVTKWFFFDISIFGGKKSTHTYRYLIIGLSQADPPCQSEPQVSIIHTDVVNCLLVHSTMGRCCDSDQHGYKYHDWWH